MAMLHVLDVESFGVLPTNDPSYNTDGLNRMFAQANSTYTSTAVPTNATGALASAMRAGVYKVVSSSLVVQSGVRILVGPNVSFVDSTTLLPIASLQAIIVSAYGLAGGVSGLPGSQTISLPGNVLTYAQPANRLYVIGDSIAQQDSPATSLQLGNQKGIATWANAYLGQRFMQLGATGYSGQTTTQILPNVAGLLSGAAALADYVWFMWGQNDVINATDNASVTSVANLCLSNISNAVGQCQALGKIPILQTILPSTSYNDQFKQACWQRINNGLRQMATRIPAIILNDLGVNWTDLTNGGGVIVTTGNFANYTDGVIHPSPRGAAWLAKTYCFQQLDAKIQPVDQFNTYWQTTGTGEVGQLNGMMIGTGGTPGTGFTASTVPTGWTLESQTPASFSATSSSKITNINTYPYSSANPGNASQANFTGGGAIADLIRIKMSGAQSGAFAAGDLIRMVCEVRILSDAGPCIQVPDLNWSLDGGGTLYNWVGANTASGQFNAGGVVAGDLLVIASPWVTNPASPSVLAQPMVRCVTINSNGSSGAASVQFGRVAVQRQAAAVSGY